MNKFSCIENILQLEALGNQEEIKKIIAEEIVLREMIYVEGRETALLFFGNLPDLF